MAKSTMSRHLAVLKQMDIIKDEGKLTLTDQGKELAKRYEEESVLLQKWFGQYLPECSEQDKHDSTQNMVVALTPDFKAKMLEKIADMVQKNSIRMIQIQPQINEIKYKHAGDKDRIADEQMELFKKAHYSPMLGMVPMLLQIPLVLGLINVIYNPMQHLMHIKTSVCDQIVAATCSLMGVDQLGSGAQLQAMAALQNPDNLSFFQNALTGTGIDIEAIAAQAATINTHFLVWICL
mgnify:CR=1 FL=1